MTAGIVHQARWQLAASTFSSLELIGTMYPTHLISSDPLIARQEGGSRFSSGLTTTGERQEVQATPINSLQAKERWFGRLDEDWAAAIIRLGWIMDLGVGQVKQAPVIDLTFELIDRRNADELLGRRHVRRHMG